MVAVALGSEPAEGARGPGNHSGGVALVQQMEQDQVFAAAVAAVTKPEPDEAGHRLVGPLQPEVEHLAGAAQQKAAGTDCKGLRCPKGPGDAVHRMVLELVVRGTVRIQVVG